MKRSTLCCIAVLAALVMLLDLQAEPIVGDCQYIDIGNGVIDCE